MGTSHQSKLPCRHLFLSISDKPIKTKQLDKQNKSSVIVEHWWYADLSNTRKDDISTFSGEETNLAPGNVPQFKTPKPHMVFLSSIKGHSGNLIQAAYEATRLFLDSSLPNGLDEAFFIFPRSVLPANQNDNTLSDQCVKKWRLIWMKYLPKHLKKGDTKMNEVVRFTPSQNRNTEHNTPDLSFEFQKWLQHPSTTVFLFLQQGRRVDEAWEDYHLLL